jgi:hypothetical protein
VNKWLSAQRVRVLVPLIGAATFAATLLGALAYRLAVAGPHHSYWREQVFGTVLITLGTVTGLKHRQHDTPTARRP